MIALFRGSFGPAAQAFAAVGPDGEAELAAALADAVERFDRGRDGTAAIEGGDAEVVALRG